MPTRTQMIDMMPYWMQREDASGDWAKTMSILQASLDNAYAILERYKEAGNPDLVDLETVVDAMLVSFGCPFDFSRLTLTQKRLLVRAQVGIFRKLGTDDAVRDVVRIFTDRVVTGIPRGVVENVWELGVEVLGDGIHPLTFDVPTNFIVLSPSRLFLIYSFMVDLDAAPTVAEQEEIAKVLKIIKPVYEHYMGVHGINPPVFVNHVELGMSDLDLTFDLH
jgi:hypothetical protein